MSGDAQERLVLSPPIPDSRDADGDASRQPGMMLLRCQENSTGHGWGPGEQPWPLGSLQPGHGGKATATHRGAHVPTMAHGDE